MKIAATLLVVLSVGCGAEDGEEKDNGIKEDLYHVEGNVLEDTCGLGGDEVVIVEWRLRKNGDGWILSDLDAGRSVTGSQRGNELTFVATINGTIDTCDYTETLTTVIEPYKTGFSGTFDDVIDFHCDDSSCHVLYEVIGIPE
jgi:hypothetical protein